MYIIYIYIFFFFLQPKNYELKPRMPSNNMRGTANNGTSVIVSGLARHVALEQFRQFITDIPNNQQQIWKNIFELPVYAFLSIFFCFCFESNLISSKSN